MDTLKQRKPISEDKKTEKIGGKVRYRGRAQVQTVTGVIEFDVNRLEI